MFITIKTFNFAHQSYLLKSRLENEGIYCFIKDELSVQINNLNSNTFGGVKLQVQEDDLERAILLLKEWDYLSDKDFQTSFFWVSINKLTASIPFIKPLDEQLRFIICLGISLLTIAILIILKNPELLQK